MLPGPLYQPGASREPGLLSLSRYHDVYCVHGVYHYEVKGQQDHDNWLLCEVRQGKNCVFGLSDQINAHLSY